MFTFLIFDFAVKDWPRCKDLARVRSENSTLREQNKALEKENLCLCNDKRTLEEKIHIMLQRMQNLEEANMAQLQSNKALEKKVEQIELTQDRNNKSLEEELKNARLDNKEILAKLANPVRKLTHYP